MGLDYSLRLSTDLAPALALDLLVAHLQGLQWSEQSGSEKNAFLFDSNIIVTAIEMDDESRSIMEEGFGYEPNLAVGFRYPSNHDHDEFKETMIQATMLLLEHAQDAVLLFNGEIIVLQRLGGKLTFNSDYHIFDDDDWLKSRLTLPYERRPLPSPLL